jgi:hypothetical protein
MSRSTLLNLGYLAAITALVLIAVFVMEPGKPRELLLLALMAVSFSVFGWRLRNYLLGRTEGGDLE